MATDLDLIRLLTRKPWLSRDEAEKIVAKERAGRAARLRKLRLRATGRDGIARAMPRSPHFA